MGGFVVYGFVLVYVYFDIGILERDLDFFFWDFVRYKSFRKENIIWLFRFFFKFGLEINVVKIKWIEKFYDLLK